MILVRLVGTAESIISESVPPDAKRGARPHDGYKERSDMINAPCPKDGCDNPAMRILSVTWEEDLLLVHQQCELCNSQVTLRIPATVEISS